MTNDSASRVLQEQLEYYRARAAEYDEWWLRQGRYDRGAELNALWLQEAENVRTALQRFRPTGRILELACGTGIWTEQLAPFATQLTAVDGSAEMLAQNAAQLPAANIRYIEADLFHWQPSEQFDTIFFAFWLSHVPSERFESFWELVRRCLAPQGRVFLIDSQHEATSTAKDHVLPDPASTTLVRRLNEGREFQIYKVFYDAAELTGKLQQLGWQVEIQQTERYFMYGSASV